MARSRVARRLALCAVARPALIATTFTLEAGASSAGLRYEAPAGCPSFSDVEPWLEVTLDASAREALSSADVLVRIEAADGAFTAEVQVKRGDFESRRALTGTDCAEVARSALVVLSVALADAQDARGDPGARRREAAPVARPAPEREPAPPRTDPEARGPDGGSAPGLAVEAGGAAAFALGTARAVPDVALGLRRELGFGSVGFRARAAPTFTVEAGDGRARLVRVAAGPEVTVVVLRSWIDVGVGARVEGGVVGAEGDGLPADRGGVSGWLAVASAVGAETSGPWRARVAAEVEARAIRPRLELGAGAEPVRLAPVGGGIGAALVVEIP